jgi:hypothetical protein
MSAIPALTPLLTMEIEVERLHGIAGTPSGERQIYAVRGGRFEGARLRGRVTDWGGDCVTRTASGSLLDVRLLLETEDGVPLHLAYQGRAGQRDGAARIEIGGRFDAPAGRYGWLNDILVFGLGTPIDGGVRYELFHFA